MAAVCHKFVMSDFISTYSESNRFLFAGCANTWNAQNSIALYIITFTKGKETKARKDVFEVIDNFGDVRNSVKARQPQKHEEHHCRLNAFLRTIFKFLLFFSQVTDFIQSSRMDNYYDSFTFT